MSKESINNPSDTKTKSIKQILRALNYKYKKDVFIQFLGSDKEIHIHYPILEEKFKNVKALSYVSCEINDIDSSSIDELCTCLGISKEDTKRISYVLIDSNGKSMAFFKNEENLEIARKFIEGIPKLNLLKFRDLLSNFSDETIFVIMSSHSQKHIKQTLSKYFYENSYMFSNNSINISQFDLLLNNFANIQNNEILILKKFNEHDQIITDSSIIYFDSEDNQFKSQVTASDRRNLYIGVKIAELKQNASDDVNFENFTSLLEFILDPLDPVLKNKYSNQEVVSSVFNRKTYLVNNLDIGIFYKYKLFSQYQKAIVIYSRDVSANKKILETLNSISDLDKSNRRILLTNNIGILTLFNIIPKPNENLTIRYIDYNSIIQFDQNNKSQYSLKDRKELPVIEIRKNKDNIFGLKFCYCFDTFNKIDFELFLKKIEEKSLLPYLESESSIEEQEDKKVKRLTANDFKEKILNSSKTNIILVVSNSGLGCVRTKWILENMTAEMSESAQFWIINKSNETPYLKKVENIPTILIYKNKKLIDELNVSNLLKSNQNWEQDLVSQLKLKLN